MTTIAYRDGVIAGDTLLTCNGYREGYATKVAKKGGALAGACGPASVIKRFLDWFRGGMEGDPPQIAEGEAAIFVPGKPVLYFGPTGPLTQNGCDFYAMGSGSLIAKGAMQNGASAEEAVRAAIALDTGSGGEITVLRHSSAEPVVQ